MSEFPVSSVFSMRKGFGYAQQIWMQLLEGTIN